MQDSVNLQNARCNNKGSLSRCWFDSIKQRRPWETDKFSSGQQILCISGTRIFITVFPKGCLSLFLSWARFIQSRPFRPVSLGSIWLSFHLLLDLSSGRFFRVFKPKYCVRISVMCDICCALPSLVTPIIGTKQKNHETAFHIVIFLDYLLLSCL
jgi:hypothetical protein